MFNHSKALKNHDKTPQAPCRHAALRQALCVRRETDSKDARTRTPEAENAVLRYVGCWAVRVRILRFFGFGSRA
jgi:hypothetical protein